MMLLFDPFLQQAVVYPDRLVASNKIATIVRAQRYQARSDEGLPLPSVVDLSMKVLQITRSFFSRRITNYSTRRPFTVEYSTLTIEQMSKSIITVPPASK